MTSIRVLGRQRAIAVAVLLAFGLWTSTGLAAQAVADDAGKRAGPVDAALTGPSGAPSPASAVPLPNYSLSVDGDIDLGGFVFQHGIPLLHTSGGTTYGNTAVGLGTLASVTPGSPAPAAGSRNSAFGYAALRNNTTGFFNTAVGTRALYINTDGNRNTAVGYPALYSNTSGYSNTAIGYRAMQYNTAGTHNTAIGAQAGINWTTGSSNIAIGRGTSGNAGDSGVIRIGGSTYQNTTFIGGIHGATATGGLQVFVNANNQLGTSTSSARFKQHIQELTGVTDRLHRLHPVSFQYHDELVNGGNNPIEYGLVAEEVAGVFPELVIYDGENKPFAVRYHLLTPLLLAELQRQELELAALRRRMVNRDRAVAELTRKVETLAASKY